MTKSLALQFRKDLFDEGNLKTYNALLRADEDEKNRYMAEVYQAITANPALLKANRRSLLASIGTAAAMGLSVMPQLGEAWLIPRKRGNSEDAYVNFQIGYKGLEKLAYRSGQVDAIDVEVVFKGEPFRRCGGTSPRIEHEPLDGNTSIRTGRWEDIECAYCCIWLKGSPRPVTYVVARWELERVRKSTRTKATKDKPAKECSDVWRDHPVPMCMKTAIIRACKRATRHDSMRLVQRVVEAELAMEARRTPPVLFSKVQDLRPVSASTTQGESELGGLIERMESEDEPDDLPIDDHPFGPDEDEDEPEPDSEPV